MASLSALHPRDRETAARSVLLIAAVGTGATAAWEAMALTAGRPPSTPLSSAVVVGVFLLLTGVAWWARLRPHGVPPLLYAAGALAGLVAMVGSSLFTRDASAAGQFGLVYLVLFVAANFRPAFAWFVTGLAVLGDALIVFTLLPPVEAAFDLVVVASGLSMVSLVLLTAGRRQDTLMARLNQLAAADPLTGLATRRELERVASGVLGDTGAARRGGHLSRLRRSPVALVLVDLDRFKELNDTHGHPLGDRALIHVARVVRDHAGPAATVARIGGDEIAVLMEEDAPSATRRAELICAAVRGTPLPVRDGAIPMSVSVGVATGAAHDGSLDDLYGTADAALYRAKAAGRDRVVSSAVRAS